MNDPAERSAAPADPASAVVAATPASISLSHTDKRYLIWLIAFSFFMQMLDSTIVNTATPSIARALNVNPLSLRSALISYVLSLAVFIPISAWFADRYGTRRIF